MARHLLLIHMMTLSLLLGDGTVQISLANGQEVQGEFIGTYMDHVHVLTGEKLYYYACDDIRSITSKAGETFDYDCSENTVTADILFPPVLDPMTGEWAQKLPDVFNPNIAHPVVIAETDGIGNEEDHIEINGVTYVRAVPKEQTTKKKKWDLNDEDREWRQVSLTTKVTEEEIRLEAKKAAQNMHHEGNHFIPAAASLGCGILGVIGGVIIVEGVLTSKMDFDNPFYVGLESGQKVVYEYFYKKEEKRLRRRDVYGAQSACVIMFIVFLGAVDGLF